MNFKKSIRVITEQELRVFRKKQHRFEKALKEPIKWHYFIVAGVSLLIGVYIANVATVKLLTFIFGTIAVLAGFFLVIMPYELLRDRLKVKRDLRKILAILEQRQMESTKVVATNVALAPEYEDENDLYIFEISANQILFFWAFFPVDHKQFPCLEFEVYAQELSVYLDRAIHCKGPLVQPIMIDPKKKWQYLKHNYPEHLEVRNISFETVLRDLTK